MEERVGIDGFGGRLGDRFESDARAEAAFARLIDASMADGAAQPAGGVSRAFNAAKALVELQEDVLGELFGAGAVAEETQGEAEDQRLVVGEYAIKVQPHTD